MVTDAEKPFLPHRELVDIINRIHVLALSGEFNTIQDGMVDALDSDTTTMICHLRGAFMFRSKITRYDAIVALAAVEIESRGRDYRSFLSGLL